MEEPAFLELVEDIYSDASEDVDDSDSDDDDGDSEAYATETHGVTTTTTESDFSGFEDVGYVNLDRHFYPDEDFMAGWSEGSRPQQTLPFTAHSGLRRHVDLPDNPKPIDFVNLFLDDEHYAIMAQETNTYARQYLERNELRPHSRFHNWKETTLQEMKVFITLIMAMGLVVMRDIRDYWSTNNVFNHPFFPKYLSRDRFWVLMSFFHLSDNRRHAEGGPNYTPLAKLGTIYKNVTHRFSSVYKPSQKISLDEGVVPWRGNLRFRTYNPDKPKKYGMKAYMVCDASNGYCCKFSLYTGKSHNQEPSEYGKIYDLVTDLMKDYYGKGHHLFVDNFYTSPILFVNLWLKKIGCTGTLRVNRKGVPKKIREKLVPKGEIFSMHNKNLLLVKYNDRKIVYLLSTVETDVPKDTGRINRLTGEVVTKPSIVCTYDKYMGGVDRADQMLSYTAVHCKTLKWWKRLFFHILNLVLLNSYLLYKDKTEDNISARKFRMEVIQSTLESINWDELPSEKSHSRMPSGVDAGGNEARFKGRHFPEKMKPKAGKKRALRTCEVCSLAERNRLRNTQELVERRRHRRRHGRETSHMCDKCKVPLCIIPCFKLYHTRKDYAEAYNARVEDNGAGMDGAAAAAVAGDNDDEGDQF